MRVRARSEHLPWQPRPLLAAFSPQVLLNTQLRDHLTALDTLLGRELTAFNELLKQRNVPNVVVKPRPISD